MKFFETYLNILIFNLHFNYKYLLSERYHEFSYERKVRIAANNAT